MLRTLFKSDLEQVLAIENAVHVSPWTEETFKACFQAGYIAWVIESAADLSATVTHPPIIGFIIISLTSEECHVLNLCVTHTAQNHGIGRQLLTHALKYAKQQGVTVAYLEVRRSNSRAISLYRNMKFHLIGERKNYYPTVIGHEDALVFAKNLQTITF